MSDIRCNDEGLCPGISSSRPDAVAGECFYTQTPHRRFRRNKFHIHQHRVNCPLPFFPPPPFNMHPHRQVHAPAAACSGCGSGANYAAPCLRCCCGRKFFCSAASSHVINISRIANVTSSSWSRDLSPSVWCCACWPQTRRLQPHPVIVRS
jgi:hypothetical protein